MAAFESKSKVHDLVQNVLSIIVQIQMAEDWGSRDRAWKTKYITDSFEVLKHKEIQHARNGLTSKEFQGWFEKNRDKYRGIEQKAITARNWTLAIYKEVSVSSAYACVYPLMMLLVWFNRLVRPSLERESIQ